VIPRFPPVAGIDDGFFWEGVQAGELRLQRCRDCGRLRQPPRPMCPDCHSLAWSSEPASGRGTVYSYVIPRHPPVPAGDAPTIIVLVELDEGARLVSNLCGADPAAVRTGMRVEVFFADFPGGFRLPQFRPAAERQR